MLGFLGPDLATVVVALLIFGICLGIIGRAAVNRHSQKKNGCPPSCCGCPHAGRCHPGNR